MNTLYKKMGTQKIAVILPCFEFHHTVKTVLNREHLLSLWKQNDIRRIQYRSHNFIDYQRYANWERKYPEDEEFYKIHFLYHFYEPYFITQRLSPL